MPAVVPLPRPLRRRFFVLGQHLRRLEVIRGLCRIALILTLFAWAAIDADAFFDFSPGLRALLLSFWVGTAISLILRLRQSSSLHAADGDSLAAAVEERYPLLGERLTTAVEVAGTTDPAHGSPELIRALLRDAEYRTRLLDFTESIPTRNTTRWGIACTSVLIAAMVVLFTMQGAASQTKRFFAPWTGTNGAAFRIVVTSGDPTIPRGEPTTLASYFERKEMTVELPSSATLLVRQANRPEEPLAMRVDERGAWYATVRDVQTPFDYSIKAGGIATEWHHVAVVDPLRIRSAAVTIFPPAYIKKAEDPPTTFEGLSSISVPQYSTVRFDIQFTSPPREAWLELFPDSDEPDAPTQKLRMELNESAGLINRRAKFSGRYRILAEADGILFVSPQNRLDIVVDAPPWFDTVTGFVTEPRPARLDDTLKVNCVANDDFGIRSVELEYRINGGEVEQLSLPLLRGKTNSTSASAQLSLAGKVRDGDTLEYRLAAADNRDIPDLKLLPQKKYYPNAWTWASLRATAGAAALAEQEILLRKKRIGDKLLSFEAELRETANQAARLQTEVLHPENQQPALPKRIGDLGTRVQETGEAMRDLAKEMALVPEQSTVGRDLAGVASGPVNQAREKVSEASKSTAITVRGKALEDASHSLESALEKLTELRKASEQLAREHLTREKLEDITDRQRRLAQQAAKANAESFPSLIEQQARIEEELKQLTSSDEMLRQSSEALAGLTARQLAAEARRLEQAQRELAQAAKATNDFERNKVPEAVRKQQEELGQRADALAAKTELAAQAARVQPLQTEEAGRAAAAIEQGELLKAVEHQEKLALELDRFAADLEQAASKARDPQERAKLLNRLQTGLMDRLARVSQDKTLDQVPAEELQKLAKEQTAIAREFDKLPIADDNQAARAARDHASSQAKLAGSMLKEKYAAASATMRESAASQQKLIEALPSKEDRLAKARAELAKARTEQEDLAKQLEPQLKEAEKADAGNQAARTQLAEKLAPLAKRQAQLAERVGKLELPEEESRARLATQGLKHAEDDLKGGLVQDIAGSQQQAKRALERLEQSLAGQTPADAQADELAQKQRQLAAKVAMLAKSKDSAIPKELARRQGDLLRELSGLPGSDSPTAMAEAKESARQAEAELQKSNPAGAVAPAARAAEALEQLAGAMSGRISEAKRLNALAKKQSADADEAEQLTRKEADERSLTASRKQARQSAEELKTLRAGESGQAAKQKALSALDRAQQASMPAQLAQAQRKAADTLAELAKQTADKALTETPEAKKSDDLPAGFPSREQAEEVRKLAIEQKKVQTQVMDAAEKASKTVKPTEGNPFPALVREQDGIARAAQEMAGRVEKEESKQAPSAEAARLAAESARKAVRQIENGTTASDSTAAAARQLRQAAEKMKSEPLKKEALDLAKRQEALNGKLNDLEGNIPAARAQQATTQQKLQAETDRLAKDLDGTARKLEGMKPDAIGKMAAAGQSAAKGAAAMKIPSETGRSEAADSIGQAGNNAEAAAKDLLPQAGSAQASAEAADALHHAQNSMQKGRDELRQAAKGQAARAMTEAADSLGRAAEQFQPANRPPKSGENGSPSSARNSGGYQPGQTSPVPEAALKSLGPDAEKYAGKPWGELPTEVKSRVLQDMRARYGEDYARSIQLYFEERAKK